MPWLPSTSPSTTKNEESHVGKKDTLDEAWDECDEERGGGRPPRVEKVTGLQSGFDRLNLAGYREAVLGDFDQSEELGRHDGFQCGFVADPEVNPSLALAHMEGQLLALSHTTNQREREAQASEVGQLLKEVKRLADLCYNTPTAPGRSEATQSPPPPPGSQLSGTGKVDVKKLKELRDRIDKLYCACDWTVPNLQCPSLSYDD